MPSHYLNQGWNIVNWTLGNKLQWNFNPKSNIFILERGLKCLRNAVHLSRTNGFSNVLYWQINRVIASVTRTTDTDSIQIWYTIHKSDHDKTTANEISPQVHVPDTNVGSYFDYHYTFSCTGYLTSTLLGVKLEIIFSSLVYLAIMMPNRFLLTRWWCKINEWNISGFLCSVILNPGIVYCQETIL